MSQDNSFRKIRNALITFFVITLLVSRARTQDLGLLSDQELGMFYVADDSDISRKLFCHWNQLKDRARLGVRFLPNCFSSDHHDGNGIDFDKWCTEQMRLSGHDVKKVAQSLVKAREFDETHDDTTEILSTFLSRLPFDIERPRKVRAVAILVCTTQEIMEFRECLSLLLLLLSTDEQSVIEDSQGIRALLKYLESVSQTAVLAQLVCLNAELCRNTIGDIDRIKKCFECLTQGRFVAPFLLEKGDQKRLRILSCDSELESRITGRSFVYRWNIDSTEFEVLEDFRSERIESLARFTRKGFFNSLFRSLKYYLEATAQEDRKAFLAQNRKQIELLCARMMQCDSVVEILEARLHFCELVRIAGDDLSEDPTYRSVEWEKCANLLEPHLAIPEFLAGRRTVDFYGTCHAISEICQAWEKKLVDDR